MKVEFLPGISHISGSRKSHMGNLVFKHRSADIPSADRPPEYIFLHGRPLYEAKNNHVSLVQVDIPDRPEGTHPVCTRADAEKHDLTVQRVLNILTWFFHEAKKRRKYDFLEKFSLSEEH